MRSLRFLFLALILIVAVFLPFGRAADGGNENMRMTYEDMPAAGKTDRTPVMQYALACLMALSVLVVVCMPARKAN